ncbi:hypothetical protein ES703_110002 [subsurface metagenome]
MLFLPGSWGHKSRSIPLDFDCRGWSNIQICKMTPYPYLMHSLLLRRGADQGIRTPVTPCGRLGVFRAKIFSVRPPARGGHEVEGFYPLTTIGCHPHPPRRGRLTFPVLRRPPNISGHQSHCSNRSTPQHISSLETSKWPVLKKKVR